MSFEKVTYSEYSDVLGRSVIPDEETFNKYKLEEIAYARTLEPFVISNREDDGFDKAVCLFIETAYIADRDNDDGRVVTGYSLDGYSENCDTAAVKTPAEKRDKWLKLFCNVSYGVF